MLVKVAEILVFRPKQATHASGSRAKNAAKVFGVAGQTKPPPLSHGSPDLSAAATHPNGRRGNVWPPPSGWTASRMLMH